MDANTILLLVLIVAVVVIGGIALMQWRRSKELKEKFGPEYERALKEKGGDQRQAEAELGARQKRVHSFELRALTPDQRDRFAEQWKNAQARFVDDPAKAVTDADLLVKQVMERRGYPVGDFEQRAADISVDHPQVVEHYREAHNIAIRNQNGKASTEDLRQAMVHYRVLFDDLLEVEEPVPSNNKELVR